MSGLEIAALVLGGVQAGAGLISATHAVREMNKGHKSSSGPVYTYYKPKPYQQFAYTNGEAEAYANKNGVYARSGAGQAIAIWKSG